MSETCFKDEKKALDYMIESKKTVFIHNAKYDMSLLKISRYADMIEDASFDPPFSISFIGGTWVRDSMPILTTSLKNAIKTFAPELSYKEEAQVEYEKINKDPQQWNNYVEQHGEELARNDARALHLVLTRFFNTINKFGTTLPTIAFKVLLDYMPEAGGLKKAILNPDEHVGLIYTINDPIILESYRGGRVDPIVIASFSEKQRIYDVNSLYPTVMKHFRYPTVPIDEDVGFNEGVRRGYLGFHRVKFRCDTDLMPVVTKYKYRGENILTQVLENEAVLTTPEVQALMMEECKIQFITNKWFLAEYLFGQFVDKYYEMKKQAEKIGGEQGKTLRAIAKMILNSSYGKFGLHKARAVLVKDPEIRSMINRDGRFVINGKWYTKIDDLIYTKEELTPRYSVAIASYVTAYARMYLYQLMKQNKDGLTYTDTDSLHMTKEIRSSTVIKLDKKRLHFQTLGDELGQLKIESEGYLYHLGKKMYFFTEDPDDWVPAGYQRNGNVAIGLGSMRFKGVKKNLPIQIHYNEDPLKFVVKQKFLAIKARLGYISTIEVPKEIKMKERLKYHGNNKKVGEPIGSV
ncbi:MAG: DNA polymerase [Candidatus Micrarchaeaceae archaeon]